MADLTIEEAREIYHTNDKMKSLMLTKFTKEELEKHEVTQEEFDKIFLKLLGQCTKTVFLDENGFTSDLPTNRIELRNSDDEWMFDIQLTGKNKHFLVSCSRVWEIFYDKYSLQYEDIQRFMKNQMKIRFGLSDVTPACGAMRTKEWMKIRFGLSDVTPVVFY